MDLSVALTALGFGALSAAALPIGAAVGISWKPGERTLAFLLAFGAGALLAALTLDLMAPGISHGHHLQLIAGAIGGGLLFKGLDRILNARGGYLRKPSTAMTYWRGEARKKIDEVLGDLHRAKPLGEASEDAKDILLELMVVREVTADTWLYRVGDPATHLFIVDEGAVELYEDDADEPFETLGEHAVFGRMSFLTGLPRATEAQVAKDSRILAIPREALMEELEESEQLCTTVRQLFDSLNVQKYLQTRHGMAADEAQVWLRQVHEALDDTSAYQSPEIGVSVDVDRVATMLGADDRFNFFSELSAPTLQRIAGRMRPRRLAEGHTWFSLGHRSRQIVLITEGSVYLHDPNNAGAQVETCGPGHTLGTMSFVTEGTHVTSAVSATDTHALVLHDDDFEDLLEESPELRERVVEFLKSDQVERYVTAQQSVEPRKAALWMEQASRSVEGGGVVPSLREVTSTVAGHKGAAMAMFLGILLDGIPESLVIGSHVQASGAITMSLLVGLFLANFPEALSSAAGMLEQGMSKVRIMLMWTGITVITGVGAAIGSVVMKGAPDPVYAVIEGVAAGAMLTMIAETMLPEAFHKGGGIVGLSTLAGFLAAVVASSF